MSIEKVNINDSEYMKELINKRGIRSIDHIGEQLRNDFEFMIWLFYKYPRKSLNYIGEELLNNPEFMLEIVRR